MCLPVQALETRRLLAVIAAAVLLALGPNLIWLGTSTVRIHNASGVAVEAVAWEACDTRHEVGSLYPGEAVLRFLEACGDDTLTILVGENAYCQTYVEGELYHVDARFDGAGVMSCAYDDLLSSLFVAKLLW